MTEAEVGVLDKLVREIEAAKTDLAANNVPDEVAQAAAAAYDMVRGIRDAGYWLQDVILEDEDE